MSRDRVLKSPVAIVLNKRFVPQSPEGPFQFGAANFALTSAKILSEIAHFAGFLLYQRQDKNTADGIVESQVFNYPALDVPLAQTEKSRRSTLQTALTRLFGCSGGQPSSDSLPIIYHQTGVLLPYAEGFGWNFVTHHGPFVSDVVDLVGERTACNAFQGGIEKIVELRRAQNAGLDVLRRDLNSFSFDFSSVQIASLVARGIPRHRILRTVAPVSVNQENAKDTPQSVVEFLERQGSALLLVAAVARIDSFKNLGLLIDVAVRLKSEKLDIAVIVAGNDSMGLKATLEMQIPSEYRSAFLFIDSLPRNEMLGMFSRLRDEGVFVVTSIFETFGITPLEAMVSGLTTIVPDLPRWIGVAEFVPEHLRFEPTFSGLSNLLRIISQDRSILKNGVVVGREVRSRVGVDRFRDDLIAAFSNL